MTNLHLQNNLSNDISEQREHGLGIGVSSDCPNNRSISRDKLASQFSKLASIYQRIAEIISGRSTAVEGERVRLGKEAVEILNTLPGGYGLNGVDMKQDGELVELRLSCTEAESELNRCLLGQRKTG